MKELLTPFYKFTNISKFTGLYLFNIKKLVFIILILFIVIDSFSQNTTTIDKINTSHGLSDNYILSINQDENGFMWFGTEWGLNRFDSKTFNVYKAKPSNKFTVNHNGTNKILVDTVDHLIWIGTKGGGLNVLDQKTQEFYKYPTSPDEANSTKTSGITDLQLDKEGNLWIATYNHGIKKLDKKNNTISDINLRNISLPENYKIKCILDDHQGNLYIGHWGNGFTVLSTEKLTTKHFEYDPNTPDGLSGNEVMSIFMDSFHNVWVGTHNGLAIYDPKKDTFTNFHHNPEHLNGLSDDDIHVIKEIDEQLWIGTWKGGINILDLKTANLQDTKSVHFKHILSNDLPSGLSSPSIEDIFQDSYGNIWIGTSGEGINVISHIKPYFNKLSYSPIKGYTNSLSDKTVNCVKIDSNNNLWVGLGNGYVDLYKKNTTTGVYNKYKSIFLDNYILCSMEDHDGNMWFGRNMDGIIFYNPQTGLLKKIDVFNNEEQIEYISSLYEDQNQNIWIGTNYGIIVYNLNDNSITKYDGKAIGLGDNYIRDIVQDINGNFWIGSAINGVSVVTQDFELIRNFNTSNRLHSNIISHIYADSQNQIWICTNNGISIFPHIKEKDYDYIEFINDSNGISDNYTHSISEGKNGEMWISTNSGISKYITNSGRIENYTNSDGILTGTFKNGAVTKSLDGTIYFGSQNGICYFNSSDSIIQKKIPPVVITNIDIYDSKDEITIKKAHLPINRIKKLKYSQNTISIDFNILDYGLKKQVEYAFLLEGMEDCTWHQTQMQNNVTFRNLSPGEYTFLVKAKIHNQYWSDQAESISFKIYPPLWLSWWAKVLYSFTFMIIAFAIVFFFRHKLKLENQLILQKQSNIQEHELHAEKMQFFTNITHELKTPLTLIIGPLEDILQNSTENQKKLSLIHKNAIRLLHLINQLMEFRKSETNHRKLTVAKDDITFILQDIVLKFKDLNKNEKVSIDLLIEDSETVHFDKEVVSIIMDNLISNSIKNTQEGSVLVKVRIINKVDTKYLEIEVADTGLGIPEEDLEHIFDRYYQVKRNKQISGTGIGLALVKNLVKLHKGSISIKSKLNQGTHVFVQFKVNEFYPEAEHIQPDYIPKETNKIFTKRLLIVEDDEDILDYISEIFSDSFEIITAVNGQNAFELAKKNIPDIIVSDVMMPIMDGIELCNAIKNNILTSHIPIVLLTAKDSTTDQTEGYLIGADSYLTKPFSASLLKSRIINLLQGREKLSKYYTSNIYKTDIISNSISDLDDSFIKKTISIIEENLGQEKISVSFLAGQHNMSYSSFSRKIKAVTGITANEFVKDIKLNNAEQLILSRKYSISEIALLIGYNSMSYFRDAFKEKFGCLPSDYIHRIQK
ncbi:hybrid sensor histidine kinase/response regulator transcription factor [Plebeiibacterium marinum]|uniref:histidine kinase n=1 Tax=Plebeiibacterium marinum TaxID=2992111 RepID=A0AAE3MDB5_9BACT|nr:hybrid sensor histidine kinase/response regulator transcription factor [Plebeiobacterium marinum]MCW3805351.1 response regulator [Plebeiobacterium marinum]